MAREVHELRYDDHLKFMHEEYVNVLIVQLETVNFTSYSGGFSIYNDLFLALRNRGKFDEKWEKIGVTYGMIESIYRTYQS